ncbi:PDZ/DHR/GLGF domain protein [Paragonimus heterotremus]|uniref:PDZ/DHR/GLGF domain protein n=1 Tax=Paragonimus heterotremus TaxID=100268 RepID=A0A8J4T3V1_9TREM|nr:PDZ/DHR/GLGF domain protein [Paragonimus heterotremus]
MVPRLSILKLNNICLNFSALNFNGNSHTVNLPNQAIPHASSQNILTNSGYEPRQSETKVHSNSTANLESFRTPVQSNLKTVHLDKRENDESLGVELVSRIFVKSVAEGGLGEKCGLRSGDRLISLNGINAAHLSLVDTANMLRRQETLIEVAEPQTQMGNSAVSNASPPTESVSDQTKVYLDHAHSGFGPRPRHRPCEHTRWNRARPDDVRFSSLRDMTYDPMSGCQRCLQAHSMQDCTQINSSPRLTSGNNPSNYCLQKHQHFQSADLMRNRPGRTCLHTITNNPCKGGHYIHDNGSLLDATSLTDSTLSSSDTIAVDFDQLKNTSFPRHDRVENHKMRQVLFRVHPQRGTGLALIGGNLSGVFISAVQPDSAADQSGLGEGDQIKEVNGFDVSGWTKEEVALALISNDEPIVLKLLHDPWKYSAVQQSGELCEQFSVRTYFSLKADKSLADRPNVKALRELQVTEGDIYNVVDTFVEGVFGNWAAQRIYPNQSELGIIPNLQRAEGHLLAGTAVTSLRAPTAYERVILLDQFPYPRPVVLYGPLAALARQRLQVFGQSAYSLHNEAYTPSFQQPPVNAFISDPEQSNTTGGLIRLSAIKACMENGSHCLLDVNTSAIQRLILLGIPPIVILINPSSKKQLQMVLQHYWDLDKTSAALFHPDRAVRKRGDIKPLAERLWNEVLALRQYRSHLITDSVSINTQNAHGLFFSEVDWLRNLMAVIQHQQNGSVWIGEDTQMAEEILQAPETAENSRQASDEQVDRPPAPTMQNIPILQSVTPNVKHNQERCNKLSIIHDEINGVPETDFQSGLKNGLGSNLSSPRKQSQAIHLESHRPSVGPYRQADILNTDNRFNASLTIPDVNASNEGKYVYKTTYTKPITPTSLCKRSSSLLQQLREQNDLMDSNTDLNTSCSQLLADSCDFLSNWDPLGPNHKAYFRSGSPTLELDLMGVFIQSSSLLIDDGNVDTEVIRTRVMTADSDYNDIHTPIHHDQPKLESITNPHLTDSVASTSKLSTLDRMHSQEHDILTGGRSTVSSSIPFTASKQILAECAGEFGYEGGTLELPEYQVCLRIPKGALPINCERQRFFLRVYDGNPDWIDDTEHTGKKVSSRLVSPLVMCGPHGLHFRTPVELTVPRYNFDGESEEPTNDWKLTLLHASANSTSADEDSNSTHSQSKHPTSWHEIPLSDRSNNTAHGTCKKSVNRGAQLGITSLVQDSQISILIDHF